MVIFDPAFKHQLSVAPRFCIAMSCEIPRRYHDIVAGGQASPAACLLVSGDNIIVAISRYRKFPQFEP